jgi:hypothetical protein
MSRYKKPTLAKIEELLKELGFSVRYEKGNFNSGYCILDDKKIIVVNRFFDTDGRVNTLLDILSMIQVDETALPERTKALFTTLLKINHTE